MWTSKDKNMLSLPTGTSILNKMRHKIVFRENGMINLSHLYNMVSSEIRFVDTQPDTNPILNVGHIFGGYAS